MCFVCEDEYAHGIYFVGWCDGEHPGREAFMTVGLGTFGQGSDPDDRAAFGIEWGRSGMRLTDSPVRDRPDLLGEFVPRDKALKIPNVDHVWHVADHVVLDDPRAAEVQEWLQGRNQEPGDATKGFASARECTPSVGSTGASMIRIVERLDALADDELVVRYAHAARMHREATLTGDRPTNAEADLIAAVYRELRRRGGEPALLPLLSSPDEGVRCWAAAHAMEFAPEEGEPVLLALAESSGLLAFNAEMTLREWRAGRLRFP
jgi:hypothetical protein